MKNTFRNFRKVLRKFEKYLQKLWDDFRKIYEISGTLRKFKKYYEENGKEIFTS